jgi:hypothetical protein
MPLKVNNKVQRKETRKRPLTAAAQQKLFERLEAIVKHGSPDVINLFHRNINFFYERDGIRGSGSVSIFRSLTSASPLPY